VSDADEARAEAESWLGQLDEDAHWARSPKERESTMRQHRILRSLLNASRKPEAAPSEPISAFEAVWVPGKRYDTAEAAPSDTDDGVWTCGHCGGGSVNHDALTGNTHAYEPIWKATNAFTADLVEQLAAAQAVIEQVRANVPADLMGRDVHLEHIAHALSQSPTDALQAHDRQVAAKALTDAADAYEIDIALYADIERRSLASEGRDADSVQDIGVAWLRARAASLVPGNPEPTREEKLLLDIFTGTPGTEEQP